MSSPDNNPTVISVGYEHTCALLSNGSIKLWGNQENGALGNGQTSAGNIGDGSSEMGDNLTAIGTSTFGAGRTVVSVACGERTTGVVLDNGEVWNTGQNNHGQLGRNGTTYQSTFGKVNIGTDNAVDISIGFDFMLILTSEGKVKAWGRNNEGQCMIGNSASPVTPQTNADSYTTLDTTGHIDITAATGQYPGNGNYTGRTAKQIAASAASAFVLLDNGEVIAWGSGQEHGMGNNSATDVGHGTDPEFVNPYTSANAASDKIIQISAGRWHFIGCTAAGNIVQWGYGQYGQMAQGNTYIQSTFVAVTSFTSGNLKAKSVSATQYASYAILTDYSLIAVGNNDDAQLGNNSNTTRYGGSFGQTWAAVTPIDLGTGRTVNSNNYHKALAKGHYSMHMGVVLDNKKLLLWGKNNKGQLGLGDTNNRGDSADEVENAIVSIGTGLYISGFSSGGGGGDPYVTTIWGDTYKLPDGVKVFRMFETCSSDKRFIFNCLAKYPEKVSSAEMNVVSSKMNNNYIREHIRNNRLKIEPVNNMTFFRYGMLQYGEEKLYVDMESLEFFNCYKDMINGIGACSEFPEWTKVVGNLERGWTKNNLLNGISGLYRKDSCYPFKINILTESHGEIGIEFYKYNNPQIRTGVQLWCGERKGIRGALVSRTKPRNIILKNLNDIRPIKDIKYNGNKWVEETFMQNGMTQKIRIKC